MSSIIRIPPHQFIHVLDNNANITSLRVGPTTYIKKDHETVIYGPEAMIRLPPRHYCRISDPVVRDAKGEPQLDGNGVVKLRQGDVEIRTAEEYPDPFPLYPGEKLDGAITPLTVVKHSEALKLLATRDFVDETTKKEVKAGDEWLFKGPATYIPRKEVEVVQRLNANVVKANRALKMRAVRACTDQSGVARKAGEEWLVRQTGAYIPTVEETVVGEVSAYVLTDKKALHLRAVTDFTDVYGKARKAGQEWLITLETAETHIVDVYEELVKEATILSLTNGQYCVVLDPIDPATGQNAFGKRELRKGECSFFLKPGESLENGIQDVYILREDQALLLSALDKCQDPITKEVRSPGDRWMVYGPRDFVPPVEVQVVEKRSSIPLDEKEGIYVRDIHTGKVRAVIGETYMLKPHEELWEKELPKPVEDLLLKNFTGGKAGGRVKTRVVTCRAPHNTAVQIYDYGKKKSRVVFGPELVLLGPDENFTLLSLSGSKPKKANVVQDLALQLGPDFSTDILVVETSDHARLELRLSYNWYFDVNKNDEKDAEKLFQVRDFVGDLCKAIASRVRACVAAVSFEEFHKNSSLIIRSGVFGMKDGKIRDKLTFPANRLVVTSVDIQSVEPVDPATKQSLAKSVQLAIEITTRSQEATAKQEAERLEQEARGRLERQMISDKADAEASRKKLLELQAESAAVQTTGQAKGEAKARAEANEIQSTSELKQSELRSQAAEIEARAKLDQLTAKQTAELEHTRALDDLEITKAREVASIEISKFKQTVDAIGKDTIQKIAKSGPELQQQLLKALGIRGYIVTDGNNPINLFSTGNGGFGPAPGGAGAGGMANLMAPAAMPALPSTH